YATDSDKRRLAPIHARLERAGARNVQIRTPRPGQDALADIAGQADLVVIDAPCSGTGAWRRNPDAKWRMRPGALEQRRKQQAEVLDRAVTLLKPEGRIAYITCSVLKDENDEQVRAFLGRHAGFAVRDLAIGVLGESETAFREGVLATRYGLLMTPRRTRTDGFFVSLLSRP
ncbi:MAG: MFS transporter, partial [Variibacter sp.]